MSEKDSIVNNAIYQIQESLFRAFEGHAYRESLTKEERPNTDNSDLKRDTDEDYKLASGTIARLFYPDELDLYSNKITHETYIFHSKEVNYSKISHFVYNNETWDCIVFMKNGDLLDLGIKIEWLVRPYLERAKFVQIVRTRKGISIDGSAFRLEHTNPNQGGLAEHKGSFWYNFRMRMRIFLNRIK